MSIHEIRARENPFSSRADDDAEVDYGLIYAGSFKRAHQYSTPPIRDEEIRAILKGVERSHELKRRGADAFGVVNKRLIAVGIFVLGVMLGGIFFYKIGMPPVLYGLPVVLAFMYVVLIVVFEFRLSRLESRG